MAARGLSKSPAFASSTGRAASSHDHSESYIGVTTAARHADGSNPSRLVTYWEPPRIDGCLVVSAVASQRATRVLALDPRVTESSEWQSKPRAPTNHSLRQEGDTYGTEGPALVRAARTCVTVAIRCAREPNRLPLSA